MRKQNVGLGKRITAFMLASILFATSMDYSVFADETQNTAEEEVETQSTDVTFMNDGYPYGKDMTSSSVTFVMDVEGEASLYQWQSADSKDGTYSDISRATQETYTTSDLTTGTWYRCMVDGTPSNAVEVVRPGEDGRYWTASYSSSWYISNGTMAYMVYRSLFDVTGYYVKDGKDYMLQTSYSKNWQLYSSTEENPSAQSYGPSNQVQPEALRVSFNEKNAYDLFFEVKLSNEYRSFSFGCDTMLGNSSTSNYADNAALKATIKKQNLKQIAMIGAASDEDANDDDPAFVITPLTDNSMFWIGKFNSRQVYAYNTRNSYEDGTTKRTTINGQDVVTSMQNADSGMTMSWTNLNPGSTVKFKFGVGSVKSTGAVGGNVDYINEKLTGLMPNTEYKITDEDDNIYTIASDEKGEFALAGKDKDGKVYDFIGKELTVERVGSGDDPADIDVSGRPSKPSKPSDMGTDTDGNPELDGKIEVAELGSDYIIISPVQKQQYAYSTDGENWNIIDDSCKNSSGQYEIKNIQSSDNKVYIRTRLAATKVNPASGWSEETELTLMQTIKATVSDYHGTYDGENHSINVETNVDGAVIKYSNYESSAYSTEKPEFKNADSSSYRVYYRIEKEGYYPSCGYV